MSEQIREQVSAFLDGELPGSETELLLKRLSRDAELRENFGRYALIGECIRGGGQARLSQGFAERVNRAIDGGPAVELPQFSRAAPRWWRPLAGVAVAASVAVVAVVALQQRNTMVPAGPSLDASYSRIGASNPIGSREAISYTVPASLPDAPAALPAARLTNYVFAHSRYSSVMGQNDMLNDLLSTSSDGSEAVGAQKTAGTRVSP